MVRSGPLTGARHGCMYEHTIKCGRIIEDISGHMIEEERSLAQSAKADRP